MGKVEFTPDRAGLAELARSSAVGDTAIARAGAGMGNAVAIAPELTGRYKRSFNVRRAMIVATGGRRVAGAVLENSAPYAHAVEARDHVLARTAAWLEQQAR